MSTFKINDKSIKCYLKIDKRAKRIKIRLSHTKEILIVSPKKISNSTIQEILSRHSSWIESKLHEININHNIRKKNPIDENTLILYRGNQLTIKNDITLNPFSLKLHDQYISINLNHIRSLENYQNILRDLILNWYFSKAHTIIPERTEYFSKIMNAPYNKISIRNQKSRWGSCSTKKNLNFNWRLILAPKQILDYLVVHELSHLFEMNHSQKFWNIVEKYCPDYQSHEHWLKKNGHLLTF